MRETERHREVAGLHAKAGSRSVFQPREGILLLPSDDALTGRECGRFVFLDHILTFFHSGWLVVVRESGVISLQGRLVELPRESLHMFDWAGCTTHQPRYSLYCRSGYLKQLYLLSGRS